MVNSDKAMLYGDRLINATELNRRPGRVLDLARERPVTIARNDEYFALLPREEMRFWVQAATLSKTVFELINVAYRLRLGEQIDLEHSYAWLKAFDTEELSELIAELESTFRQIGLQPGAIEKLDATIHEWHESAIAISSPTLAAAFSDEVNEVLLTPPHTENATESVKA